MTLRAPLVYFCTLAILLGLDAAFLGAVAVPQFKAALGGVLLERPRLAPAILFYLLYAGGLLIFVSLPARGAWTQIVWRGALFGLIAYATYDLTNYATLRPWTLKLVLMDLAWGAIVSAAASAGGAWAGTALAGAFR